MQIQAIAHAAETIALKGPKLAKLKKACQDLEAVFVKDLLTVMRKSATKTQFADVPGDEIYDDMFNQSIADSAAKSGSFGIAKELYKTLAPAVMREKTHSNDKKGLDIKG